MRWVRVDIDEELLEDARQLLGATTKWEVVDFALRRIVENNRRRQLLRTPEDRPPQDGVTGESRNR
jgi:Arc/MetJ family transcription regulator